VNAVCPAAEPAPDQAEAMRAAAACILVALDHVQTSAGPDVAATMGGLMVQLATGFLFERIGPAAARRVLVETYASLDAAIAEANGGTPTLS
jgi:hypothetical protein